jgi:hypothetical protein
VSADSDWGRAGGTGRSLGSGTGRLDGDPGADSGPTIGADLAIPGVVIVLIGAFVAPVGAATRGSAGALGLVPAGTAA